MSRKPWARATGKDGGHGGNGTGGETQCRKAAGSPCAEPDERGTRRALVTRGPADRGSETDGPSLAVKRGGHVADPHAQAETIFESHPLILKSRPVAASNDRRSAAGTSPPGAKRRLAGE